MCNPRSNHPSDATSEPTSPDMNSSNNDSTVNKVFIWVLVIMGLLVLGSAVMFIKACCYELNYKDYHDKWMAKRDSLYSDLIHPDSVLIGISKVPTINGQKTEDLNGKNQDDKKFIDKYLISKEEVMRIQESQKLLYLRQDQLTDEIRQETNNMINKMNGWLGFWMGVMAILGVFVPIALQLKLYRENRDNDAKLRQEYKDELKRLRQETENYKTECERVQRTEQAELQSERLKIETDINKRFEEFRKEYEATIQDSKEELKITKFTAIIRSFHNIIDSPEIKNTDLRNLLLEDNWKEIKKYVHQLIEDYSQDESTDKPSHFVNPYVMSVMLIQVSSVLTSFRILVPRRKRKLEILSKEAFDIIQLLNTHPINKEKIIRRLNNYRESLVNLHPMEY